MTDLEKEGIAILNKYGAWVKINLPLRGFLKRVAKEMGWEEFGKML